TERHLSVAAGLSIAATDRRRIDDLTCTGRIHIRRQWNDDHVHSRHVWSADCRDPARATRTLRERRMDRWSMAQRRPDASGPPHPSRGIRVFYTTRDALQISLNHGFRVLES